MERIELGEIQIDVQNEKQRNEDIYKIKGSYIGKENPREVVQLLTDHIEDPERFVVNLEDHELNVYTKQPDAAIQLALFLNRQRGAIVDERQVNTVRDILFSLQQ